MNSPLEKVFRMEVISGIETIIGFKSGGFSIDRWGRFKRDEGVQDLINLYIKS
jgi:hypothetical protein